MVDAIDAREQISPAPTIESQPPPLSPQQEALYDEVYQTNFSPLVKYIMRNNISPDAAQDIAQQVFIKVLERFPRYEQGFKEDPNHGQALLRKIAKTTTIDDHRRNSSKTRGGDKIHVPFDDDITSETPDLTQLSPEDQVEQKERVSVLTKDAGLAEREETILALFIAGNTYGDISRQTGIGEHTIKTIMFRLRDKIRKQTDVSSS